MKRKKLKSKLTLGKEKISNLNMTKVKGGIRDTVIGVCYTAETVCITLKC